MGPFIGPFAYVKQCNLNFTIKRPINIRGDALRRCQGTATTHLTYRQFLASNQTAYLNSEMRRQSLSQKKTAVGRDMLLDIPKNHFVYLSAEIKYLTRLNKCLCCYKDVDPTLNRTLQLHIFAFFSYLGTFCLLRLFTSIKFSRHWSVRLSQPFSFATLIKIPEWNLLLTRLTKELWQVKVIQGLTQRKGNFHDLMYFPTWIEVIFGYWVLW